VKIKLGCARPQAAVLAGTGWPQNEALWARHPKTLTFSLA
jgi:hypothetical protein